MTIVEWKPLEADALKSLVQGAPALGALLLAYAYFAVGWASTQVHHWEQQQPPRVGSPTLACWIAVAGQLVAMLIAAHMFAGLYLCVHGKIDMIRLPMLICMAGPAIWMWWLIYRWLRFYVLRRGQMAGIDRAGAAPLPDGFSPLVWSIPLLCVTGIGAIVEMFFGRLEAGVFGVMYEVSAAYGVGAHAAVRGDLIVRISEAGNPGVTNSA